MKSKLYSLLAGALLLGSCDKLEDTKTPDFQVSTESATYAVGQPITFNFEGHADLVSFYSGQPLNDYAFKEGRVIETTGAGATLSFSTSLQGAGTQKNEFEVLASTDFNGNYADLASVMGATWIDITSRFTLSPGTSSAFTPSTAQDISDLLVAGKPIYIAYKYGTKPQKDNGLSRQWLVEVFSVKSKKEFINKPLTISDQANAGFVLVDKLKDLAPSRSLTTPSRVTLYSSVYKDPASPIYDPNSSIYDPESPDYNPDAVFVPYDPASPANDPAGEVWAISKPIYTESVDLGPDKAIGVKGMENQTPSYTYTYNTPGTYEVNFVAKNATIEGSSEVIRTIRLTITP